MCNTEEVSYATLPPSSCTRNRETRQAQINETLTIAGRIKLCSVSHNEIFN